MREMRKLSNLLKDKQIGSSCSGENREIQSLVAHGSYMEILCIGYISILIICD